METWETGWKWNRHYKEDIGGDAPCSAGIVLPNSFHPSSEALMVHKRSNSLSQFVCLRLRPGWQVNDARRYDPGPAENRGRLVFHCATRQLNYFVHCWCPLLRRSISGPRAIKTPTIYPIIDRFCTFSSAKRPFVRPQYFIGNMFYFNGPSVDIFSRLHPHAPSCLLQAPIVKGPRTMSAISTPTITSASTRESAVSITCNL